MGCPISDSHRSSDYRSVAQTRNHPTHRCGRGFLSPGPRSEERSEQGKIHSTSADSPPPPCAQVGAWFVRATSIDGKSQQCPHLLPIDRRRDWHHVGVGLDAGSGFPRVRSVVRRMRSGHCHWKNNCRAGNRGRYHQGLFRPGSYTV